MHVAVLKLGTISWQELRTLRQFETSLHHPYNENYHKPDKMCMSPPAYLRKVLKVPNRPNKPATSICWKIMKLGFGYLKSEAEACMVIADRICSSVFWCVKIPWNAHVQDMPTKAMQCKPDDQSFSWFNKHYKSNTQLNNFWIQFYHIKVTKSEWFLKNFYQICMHGYTRGCTWLPQLWIFKEWQGLKECLPWSTIINFFFFFFF